MKKTVKVDMEKFKDSKYQSLLKNEMTKDDISQLGTIILKDKIANLKYKILSIKNKFKRGDIDE